MSFPRPVLSFAEGWRESGLGAIVLFLLLLLAGCSARPARTFTNPILSGFYPDPSICRVGDDYYMVHSSFEYFPGVPIFHSRDLVHWRQIGHCLTRKSQLTLDKIPASGGIFAPALRFHDGTFYMITTNVYGGGNFYVTAKDPAGPWSDPVWLDPGGIDPSLFFDNDGIVYYTRHEGMGDGYIAQGILNLDTGKLEGPLQKIWDGTGGVWPEGPHLYKINGIYYLMISEGGTSYDHMLTIARSDSPFGPFEAYPDNPILTHRHRPDHPLQALGHGDLVETPDGWWLVCLGIRPQGGRFHHIGRETFLAPVTWNEDNWPIVNENGTLEITLPAPNLSPHPFNDLPARDEFEGKQLGFQWNYLRNPHDDYSLTKRPGWLRLNGSPVTMNDQDSPCFVGHRQTDLTFSAVALLDFNPSAENEEAGLVLRGNEKNHYEIGITLKDGRRSAFYRKVLQGKTQSPITYVDIPQGDIMLFINGSPIQYEFSCHTPPDGPKINLGKGLTKDLSSEIIGGFTGVYIGMYATGNGLKCHTPADFAYFEYIPQ